MDRSGPGRSHIAGTTSPRELEKLLYNSHVLLCSPKMDVRICAGLAFAESLLINWLNKTSQRPVLSTTHFGISVLALLGLQWILLKIYRVFVYPHFFSPLRNLPGPKDGHFLVGQMLNQYRASSPVQGFLDWSVQWPDEPLIKYFGLANNEMLLINTVEAHKQILQAHCYDFIKPEFIHRSVGEIVGTGLLLAEKQEHKRQRRLVLNVFSVPNIKKLLPVFQEEARLMVKSIKQKLQEEPTGDIDVLSIFSKAALNSIGLAAMGIKLENLKDPETGMDCQQCYRRMLSQSTMSALISFINVHLPIRWAIPLEANLGYVRAMHGLRSMISRYIDQRSREIAQGDKEKEVGFESRDLLTYMLEERESTGEILTTDQIMGHLQNFLAAGHETTAGTLTWATYVLATRPDIQDKLRSEIKTLTEGTPDYASIERLHYLNNFFREVTRLYSTAPFTYREADSDIVICGRFVPKGTHLVMSPFVSNLSTQIWGENAREFRLERWDSLTGDAATPYGIETFSNGPRVCIGKMYAVLLFKAFIVQMLQDFRFSKSADLVARGGKFPEIQNPGVTYRPKGDIKIHVERLH
ncbi:cytochrome P450 3A5 [Biscogniauxia marginata]|nr:cytochrome P450 3A5 [Biscogniauxia marginata]